jgi:hypothetical protein
MPLIPVVEADDHEFEASVGKVYKTVSQKQDENKRAGAWLIENLPSKEGPRGGRVGKKNSC